MIVLTQEDQLLSAIGAAGETFVTVDGWPLSGKTCLGTKLARHTGRRLVDLDDLLMRDQGGFVDHLDYDALKELLDSGLSLVITGVCMKAVLERVGPPHAVSIYVKRMHGGEWSDEDEAIGPADLSERHELYREVRRYHDDYKPHERADYLFERAVGLNES